MTKYLIFALIILGFISSAYFKYSQNEIEILTKSVVELKVVNEANTATIATLKTTIQENEQANLELQKKLQTAEQYSDALSKKLRIHNLTRLSIERSVEIQTKINSATTRLFREIERETGKNVQ